MLRSPSARLERSPSGGLQRLRFLPEAVLFGPSLARYLLWSRSDTPLQPEAVWQRFTRSGHAWGEWLLRHWPPGPVRKLWASLYPRLRDRVAGVEKHYNVSNAFYALFLDHRFLFYTCADFLQPHDSLEDAQAHKANFLLGLIDPQPGQRILDLGCGWGGMLNRIAAVTGDPASLQGWTLSQQQQAHIQAQAPVRVEIRDFVSAPMEANSWDTIVSIGSLEHVPRAQLLPLARKLAAAITPSGRIVHHFFCQLEADPPARLLVAGFDIFPGAELATLAEHLDAFEAAGLKVMHHSAHDYRPTLAAWFDRLAAQQQAAIDLVGVRITNKYLCYLAEAWRLFHDRDLLVMRFVLQRRELPLAWTSPLYRPHYVRTMAAPTGEPHPP